MKNSLQAILFIMLLNFTFLSKAQSDSTMTAPVAAKKQETVVKQKKKHSPTKATLYSLAVPGLGQAYNKKYWKLPIIYGLGGWFVYNIATSHSQYTDYREALFTREDPDDLSIDQYNGIYSDDQLRTRKDFYKRKRDINVIYALLLYSANIIDAAVDAHLMDFEVGEKYIMSLEPTFFPTASVSNSIGLSLSLNLR